jgi:hypothetical protein
MSLRARLILAGLGLLIACCSLAMLGYALASVDHVTEQVPIAPTLFVPPR